MEFGWDEAKNREDLLKHDVSFEMAREVFDDPVSLTQPDFLHDYEEQRWIMLGAVGSRAILFVVHTLRGEETIRIISARFATLGKGKLMKKTTRGRPAGATAVEPRPDAEIDLSEMPEVVDWSGAEIGKFYRSTKKPVTLRLDGDVIEWLKSFGPGYQTRVNGLLRHAMESSKHRASAQ